MIHEKKKQLQISLSLHRALPRQQSLVVGGGGRRLHRGDERRPVRPRRDGRRHLGLLAAQLRGRRGREREALGQRRVRGCTDQQRRRRVGLGQVAHRRAARREALVGALPAAAAARQHLRGGEDGGRGGVGAAPRGREDGRFVGYSRTNGQILQSQAILRYVGYSAAHLYNDPV